MHRPITQNITAFYSGVWYSKISGRLLHIGNTTILFDEVHNLYIVRPREETAMSLYHKKYPKRRYTSNWKKAEPPPELVKKIKNKHKRNPKQVAVAIIIDILGFIFIFLAVDLGNTGPYIEDSIIGQLFPGIFGVYFSGHMDQLASQQAVYIIGLFGVVPVGLLMALSSTVSITSKPWRVKREIDKWKREQAEAERRARPDNQLW